jgi:phosphate transport system ATP-binding protein
VGIVFAVPVPLPLSIWENVTYGPLLGAGRNRSDLDELVEASLKAAALWEEVKDRLNERPISTMKVEEALVALKEKHCIVIVPHNVQQASRIGDKAAFLLMGELVEYGAGEQIFTRPTDPRTDDYITGRFG